MKYGFLRIYLATLGVIIHRIRHYRALHLLLDLSAVVVLPATGRTMMDRGGARTGAVVDAFIGFIVAPFLVAFFCTSGKFRMRAIATMADAVTRALTVDTKSAPKPLGRVQSLWLLAAGF